MKRSSILQSLLRCLVISQVLIWLAGLLSFSVVALWFMRNEIDHIQERQLQALAQRAELFNSGLLSLGDTISILRATTATHRFLYRVTRLSDGSSTGDLALPSNQKRAITHTPADRQVRHSTVFIDGESWRVACVRVPLSGGRDSLEIVMARPDALSNAYAARLVTFLMVPLLMVAVVQSLVLAWSIRRKLSPLQRLVREIKGVPGGSLHPVVMREAPREVRAVLRALNHLLSQAQNNVNSEKRFIGDAAHQLRTPMAGLISQAELALNENDPEKMRQRIVKMHNAAQRSAHLVQQMLALARTEGSASCRMEHYDLAELARKVASEWNDRAWKSAVDLGYEGDEHARVWGNPILMCEALGNMIDNAIHYTGPGTLVTVKVSAPDMDWMPTVENPVPCVLLEVEDNGPGVPPESLSKLFERFWRADENMPGGCGLGLALVRRVADLHRATVGARLLTPHGLRISMAIPVFGKTASGMEDSSIPDTRWRHAVSRAAGLRPITPADS